MSHNLKQKKPLPSNPNLLRQTDRLGTPQSFAGHKVILQELTNWNFNLKHKVKLIRFRKCTLSKQLLQNFKASHTLKSLKSVKDITIYDPIETLPKRQVRYTAQYVKRFTKVQTVKLMQTAYGTSYSLDVCFSSGWDEVYKMLRSFNPKKIKFHLHNARLRIFQNFVRSKLNWWQNIFRLLSCMSNLGFVCVNDILLDWLQYSAKCKMSDYINPIRRRIKLKEVVLGGLEELISDWKTAYKYFLEAPNLEKLTIKVGKTNLSRPTVELINNIKHLTEINLQGFLDISDSFI